MADEDNGVSEPRVRWPKFTKEQTVVGMKLLDLIDWVFASSTVLAGGDGPPEMPVIAMPPVQRTAVWRPKQVLDLWDSLMRGLPIGTFYLVERPTDHCRMLIPLGHSRTISSKHAGFDLLDGQQRVRALSVGAVGPGDEKRCLGVDLGAKTAGQNPCLHVTSKAQPFGYDTQTGDKLRTEQRRRAREEIEPDSKSHPIMCDDGRGSRRKAYDLDLFDGKLTQDCKPLDKPLLPHGASKRLTFKLHELLAAWRERSLCDPEGGIKALRHMVRDVPEEDNAVKLALKALDQAFHRIKSAEVALLRVDPQLFHGDGQGLLVLFQRIGAGGTPLSIEEQLFSIYKHYKPMIRDAVDDIYDRVGRVLPPTKIAATALRIANASTSKPAYYVPSVTDFAAKMVEDEPGELRTRLEELIPEASSGASRSPGSLSEGFVVVKRLLSYRDDSPHSGTLGAFWMPDVMLALLPAELWQVLVFWATRQLSGYAQLVDWESSREEMVRFALFWRLCVASDEKAASWAFEYIKKSDTGPAVFPGAALYQRFVGTPGDSLAYALILPGEFERRLCKECSPGWRDDAERFVEENKRNYIGAAWWWSGREMLPWLQRDYVRGAFPGYVPLTDHEDDLPYDIDHVVPKEDWNNWVSIRRRVPKMELAIQRKMQWHRGGVGESIGNKRLVDSATNARDKDDDISKKMPFLLTDDKPDCEVTQKLAEMAFSPDPTHLATWKKVSRCGPVESRNWDSIRLAAFQKAVEQRAAWLYRQFHERLEFCKWPLAQRQDDASEGEGDQG